MKFSTLFFCSQEEELPVDNDGRRGDATYHHWVPFYLAMAALGCLLPYVIWRMLSGLLWINAHLFAQTMSDNQRQNASARHVILHDSALLLKAGLKGGSYELAALVLLRKMLVGVTCLIQVC